MSNLQALGWISAALYVLSRIPQLLDNFKRKSTEGLSIIMFIMAVRKSCDSPAWNPLLRHRPSISDSYLIGS
jgi:PQ loop repeat protein